MKGSGSPHMTVEEGGRGSVTASPIYTSNKGKYRTTHESPRIFGKAEDSYHSTPESYISLPSLPFLNTPSYTHHHRILQSFTASAPGNTDSNTKNPSTNTKSNTTAIMSSVSPLTGPLLWTTELADTPAEYTLALDASECAEIKTAFNNFRCKFKHITGHT